MEFEQIVKRLEFLDKQQRENKDAVTRLTERLTSFESNVDVATKQIKTASKQLTDITPVTKRMEQFEMLITKQRTDILKLIEENEKIRIKNEKESLKLTQTELEGLNKSIAQIKNTIPASITDIKKELKERGNELQRVLNNMSDLKTRLDDSIRSNEDVSHSLQAMDETRKNDLKRVSDLQGEITAVRKRVDEGREKNTMQADSIRNIENRFAELLASETERRQAQTAFLDQQAIAQIDRDRAWKDWKEKYDNFQSEAAGIETRVQTLDEALRNAKKAQETYLELNAKLERRINEVTEMQRLAEDRLRQEWVSFKADDQKRWTGYSLSSEESFRDIRKDVQKVTETITTINDISNNLQDAMHQTTDVTEKQLQEMMNAIHEWMTSYQRIMGHGKKTKKT
jgi:chromosome segregation ATPase